jgi:hypothetical protein
MNAADKHFKIINSRTGYVIYYCSLSSDLDADAVKSELEKIKAKVAVKNGVYEGTIYWEEVRDEE